MQSVAMRDFKWGTSQEDVVMFTISLSIHSMKNALDTCYVPDPYTGDTYNSNQHNALSVKRLTNRQVVTLCCRQCSNRRKYRLHLNGPLTQNRKVKEAFLKEKMSNMRLEDKQSLARPRGTLRWE